MSFYALSTFSLIAQKQFTSSKIISKLDSSIISHAHIINLNSKTGVTSNENGMFSISTKPEDTLFISFIGFESLKVQASEIENNIYLNRAIHTIETYTVLPYKDDTDERPTIVTKRGNDFILFSSKIGNCVDASEDILNIIKNEINEN